ncbi:MAG: hypothetical protein N2038_04605 [Geminicoccaceae bacterium]|nr:hypothetical protein [Geminicoccaceae bacterium]MCS7267385.1 hypothetical protein [Geminicoccaceae bacterium]MCX7629514.1 hypothetical protein [Geminicoccaceae bacterium]MDW8123608.1 hypothetical protein [Geminicoccaceae bacterium]MDW8339949.1 hypothetical protein [Geminicoccaceae bacterium]
MERRRGPAPADVLFRATMTGIGGGCRYEGGDVVLSYALDIALVPGPAAVATDTALALPWFVAVADPSGAVIDKQLFELRGEAPAPGRPRVVVERLEQRIRGVSPAEGPRWRIYFGFELDPEEARARLRERAR